MIIAIRGCTRYTPLVQIKQHIHMYALLFIIPLSNSPLFFSFYLTIPPGTYKEAEAYRVGSHYVVLYGKYVVVIIASQASLWY